MANQKICTLLDPSPLICPMKENHSEPKRLGLLKQKWHIRETKKRIVEFLERMKNQLQQFL